jgi:ATP adenylyltransferase
MPNDLPQKIETAHARASASGALQPIATKPEHVDEAGVRWTVYVMPGLARKAAAATLESDKPAAAQPAQKGNGAPSPLAKPAFDPFAEPEADLVVEHVSPTHTLLLNKFSIIERHLLIVTRRFEHQESLLGADDFDALARCMDEVDGIGFYNAGAAAGASQAHKHLQLVAAQAPIEPLLDAAQPPVGSRGEGILRVPALDFRHAFARLAPSLWDHPARSLTMLYRELLATCGLGAVSTPEGERQSGPYNLLVSRRWMLVVPRSRGRWENIWVSALCYAGILFVRGEDDAARLRAAGPLAVLAGVAPAP